MVWLSVFTVMAALTPVTSTTVSALPTSSFRSKPTFMPTVTVVCCLSVLKPGDVTITS
jgi:hypothetical protein